MPNATTFRVFVSSTFNDLKAERNALRERVFPKLRELCGQYGCRFQPVDLRWGVSEQAAFEQSTLRICLDEIARCQQLTPRPNFIALLGDRYGWRPLPSVIAAEEYEAIAERVGEATARALLQQWYRRDENAIPPEYVLLPRAGRHHEHAVWEREVESVLRGAIATALRHLDWSAEQKRMYQASATEQEIRAGALGIADAPEHVFCFARVIHGLPPDRRAGAYIDLDAEGNVDVEAQGRLKSLKGELFDVLGPDHVFRYDVRQLEEAKRLTALRPAADPHELFRRQRAIDSEMWQLRGEPKPGDKIDSYLAGTSRHCLALLAEPGSGVSGVMARAVERARVAHPDAHLLVRFVGVTPESLDGHALLAGLCEELRGHYAAAGPRASTGVGEVEVDVRESLGLATSSAPLIVFLDGLGQLPESDATRSLVWLPRELPEHVHLVLSTSTQAADCCEAIAARVPAENRLVVRPFELVSRERASGVLDECLVSAGRKLQDDQREHAVVRLTIAGAPLYVRTFQKFAFEEVKRWRSFDGVPIYRGRSGFADDVEGIFRDLLWRLQVGGSHGQVLVSRSLAYLGASRMGLAEDELLDLLTRDVEVYAEFLAAAQHFPPDIVVEARKHLARGGAVDDPQDPATLSDAAAEVFLRGLVPDPSALRAFLAPVLAGRGGPSLPIVLWARLRDDLEPYLHVRDADGLQLVDFFHRSLSEVVSEDHLAATGPKFFHRILASYFAERPLRAPGTAIVDRRRISELPYQQTKGELWSELAVTLTDFDFLVAKAQAAGKEELLEDLERAEREGLKDPDDGRAAERDALTLVRESVRQSGAVPLAEGTQFAELLVARLGTSQNPLILRLLRQAGRG